jgi:hypothetical protein
VIGNPGGMKKGGNKYMVHGANAVRKAFQNCSNI